MDRRYSNGISVGWYGTRLMIITYVYACGQVIRKDVPINAVRDYGVSQGGHRPVEILLPLGAPASLIKASRYALHPNGELFVGGGKV